MQDPTLESYEYDYPIGPQLPEFYSDRQLSESVDISRQETLVLSPSLQRSPVAATEQVPCLQNNLYIFLFNDFFCSALFTQYLL